MTDFSQGIIARGLQNYGHVEEFQHSTEGETAIATDGERIIEVIVKRPNPETIRAKIRYDRDAILPEIGDPISINQKQYLMTNINHTEANDNSVMVDMDAIRWITNGQAR